MAVAGLQQQPLPPLPSTVEVEPMSKRFVDWLEEVNVLISTQERNVFTQLTHDHHRDAFIRQFWRFRDPYPQTARNEFRENWDERIFTAREEYGGLNDDRSRILLVHGPPQGVIEVRCTTTRKPAIVWSYAKSDQVDFGFVVIFLLRRGRAPARLWLPGMGGSIDAALASARACLNGSRVQGLMTRLIGRAASYAITMRRVLAKPKPYSEEWVSTFASYTTDVPEDAERFPAAVEHSFLGRVQSRTAAQVSILVPKIHATIGEFAGFRSYNYLLTGEVVLGDQLFESFRYKFGFPAEDSLLEYIPMAFQRYLRPGDYTLILKLEDLNSKAFFRHEMRLKVPRLEQLAALPEQRESEAMALFREAIEVIAGEETAVRIIPPLGSLHSGRVRFDTIASGSDIHSMTFFLDDREILTKNRPPFNVEIDLGPFPRLRTLRAEARDSNGLFVTEHQILLNAGEHRFAVQLIEPRRGQQYDESLQAKVRVEVPPGETIERVEIFLNQRLMATLYQAPFVQPLRLPSADQISYVRAVAHLVDGSSTEDLVFVNSPDYLEAIDVQFVELYTAVLDSEGHPIRGLEESDFTVVEDGVRQEVVRFEQVEDLPIHAVILIDNSASMAGTIDRARNSALRFFQHALKPRDRAAVVTFNRFPELAVKFTNDHTQLGAALQGLTAEGQTALYDSLMFSLYYFTGIKGQRAILLLSDGKDEVSRFGYEETLEYARRAGVTIYTIGLAVKDGGARRKLVELANETGGRSYLIADVLNLPDIYTLIEQDLRSQYLIAYQSTNRDQDATIFRTVDVVVRRPKATVRTLAGYYP